jgi:hypothetical protein
MSGKRASSRNARKHGLRAAAPAQTEADRQWLAAFRDQLLASLNAEQARDLDLVEQVVAAEFLLRLVGLVFAERLLLLGDMLPKNGSVLRPLTAAAQDNASTVAKEQEAEVEAWLNERFSDRVFGEVERPAAVEMATERRRLAQYEKRFRGHRDRALRRLLRSH